MMRKLFSFLFLIIGTLGIYAQSHDICMDPKTKKYGVCYADTIRVPQIYDFGQYINSFAFILAKDGKYGVVDRYGNFIIEMIYDHMWEFTEMPDELLVRQGNKYGILNLKGKTIVPLYELQAGEINTFHIDEHLSFARKDGDFQVIHDGKMAVYNMQGKLIFDFIYPFVQDILVEPEDQKKPPYYIFLVGDAGKYSFVDHKNKPIFKNIVAEEMYSVYHAWGAHTKGILVNGTIRFINIETGTILEETEMADMLQPFNMVQNLEDQMGAIDDHGQFRIPCVYNNIVELPEVDFVTMEKNGKKGLMNLDGEILIEPVYDNVAEICFDGMNPTLFPYEVDNGKWMAIFMYDPKIKKMVPKTSFMYSDITCFELTKEGLKAYLTDSTGKKGLLLPNGKIEMTR
jgi:uncharacterized pyridoxamine 5'-phosphate oxidase family protein